MNRNSLCEQEPMQAMVCSPDRWCVGSHAPSRVSSSCKAVPAARPQNGWFSAAKIKQLRAHGSSDLAMTVNLTLVPGSATSEIRTARCTSGRPPGGAAGEGAAPAAASPCPSARVSLRRDAGAMSPAKGQTLQF